ncbi:hypothetical protein BC629DRAFT_238579 [Irpex lacteus]|nr:hypothetical protein BC629DRAFT_238579 [Irpex lacteus]
MENDELDQKTITSATQPDEIPVVTSSWPVPQVIISFDGENRGKSAWGREGLKRIGYPEAAKFFCKVYVYNSVRDGPKWQKFLDKHYMRIRIMGRFRDQYGQGLDEGWIRLQPIGWAELIDNVIEILVVYDETVPLQK